MGIQLNPGQQEAVRAADGRVLVLAGAGSGKTRVLTERIVSLIRDRGVSPERVLAFTFTNKAAGEMRSRIESSLGHLGVPLWIGTFHATGLRILRKEAEQIGFRRNFAVYDEDDRKRLLKDLIKKRGWKLDEYPPAAAGSRISGWKNALVTPEEAQETATDLQSGLHAEIYSDYVAELRRCNAFDFDDLITRVVQLFEARPRVKERYSRQFRYVLVDEFQDTNKIQMLMIDYLSSMHGNLFVVGDDDQAIYGWRGATIDNILQFDRLYEGVRTIRLEENYRSTNTILEASNLLIANNAGRKGKTLWSSKGRGKSVRVYYASDEREEAAAVREAVIRLIRAGFRRDEIAVLYRTHAQARALESAMLRGGLPYQIIGGTRFYERKEIRDLLGYLKLISNPDDDVNFRRILNVPRRGIGKVSLERIEEAAGEGRLLRTIRGEGELESLGSSQRRRVGEFAALISSLQVRARTDTAYEILSEVVEKTGYRDHIMEDPSTAQTRLENVEELLNETERFSSSAEDPSLDVFLEEIALISDIDTMKDEDRLNLMTLHNSKGLEFRAVCITGLEEGLLPHYSSFDDLEELEEERRLFYVGMTRAMEELYLFCAAGRMQFGNWTGKGPSRFLDEIPEGLVEVSGSAPAARRLDSAPGTGSAGGSEGRAGRTAECSRFREGALVYHPKYGEGRIRKLEGSGNDLKVSVQFAGYGTKKFLASYAPFSFRK